MKSTLRFLGILLTMGCLTASGLAQAGALRLHAIFDSDMVLQRGKPSHNPSNLFTTPNHLIKTP